MGNPPLSMRFSSIAIAFFFASLGLELGLWGAMIPLISERLALTPLDISLFLLLIGMSLVISALTLSRFTRVFSSKLLVWLFGPLYIAGFIVALLAPNRTVFFVAAIWVGLASGILDGAINLQAIAWEKRSKRKMLSTFHGMYTLGVMCGAGYWLAAKHLGMSQLVALVSLFTMLAPLLVLFAKRLLDDEKAPETKSDSHISLPLGLSLLIGILILLATTIEGGMIDWNALFLIDEMKISKERAGMGVVIFAACMTLGRFCGDWLAERIQPIALLAWPMLCAGILLGVAVLSRNLSFSLLAFGFLGLAVANSFPLLLRLLSYRLEPEDQVRAVARVIGFAYFGIISGPVVLGLIAEHFSLSATMLGISLLTLLFALTVGGLLKSLWKRTEAT